MEFPALYLFSTQSRNYTIYTAILQKIPPFMCNGIINNQISKMGKYHCMMSMNSSFREISLFRFL